MNTGQLVIMAFTIICFNQLGLSQITNHIKPKVGDKAPDLRTVSKWLKGDSIVEFSIDDKMIYVVNFTGTWCGSCIRELPRLTKLEEKYMDKFAFIHVFLEKEDTEKANIARVYNLIERLGKNIGTNIAVDAIDRSSWGGRGFYIVRNGKIVWSGDKTMLDAPLNELKAGAFDPAVAQLELEAYRKIVSNIRKNVNGGDFQSALSDINDLIVKAHDGNKRVLYALKFDILTGIDEKKAYEWLKLMLDTELEGFHWTSFVQIAFYQILPENRNYNLELQAVKRAIELEISEWDNTETVLYLMLLKAEKYADMKDYQKAINICHQVIEDNNRERENLAWARLEEYTYKLLANESPFKANAWLRDKLQDIHISPSLVETVVEVITASPSPEDILLAHELVNRALNEETRIAKHFLWSQKAALYTASGEYTLAHKWIDKVFDAAGLSGFYLSQKASIYAAAGEFKKAITLCQEAIEMTKGHITVSEIHRERVRRLGILKEYKKQLTGYMDMASVENK